MASLGEQLKNIRISSGKSLDDVSRDTNISKHYLESLEENNYDVFPGPVYVRGFLNTYAKYLGLEPRAVVRQYDKLTAFNELLDKGAFQSSTINRIGKRHVIRRRVIMLLFAVLLVIACLVGLILKRI